MYEALTITSPPAGPSPSTLALFKRHCRVDASDTTEDVLLAMYLTAATNSASARLKQTLAVTSYQLVRDLLPSQAFNGPTQSPGINIFVNSSVIPYSLSSVFRVLKPPLISVESIHYRDTSGVVQTLSPSAYVVVPAFPGRIAPAYGQIWPFTLPQIGSVTINYTAGYGSITTTVAISGGITTTTQTTTGPGLATPIVATSSAPTVPADVAGTTVADRIPSQALAAIFLWGGSLYRNREAVTEGVLSPMPMGVQDLLDACSKGFYR